MNECIKCITTKCGNNEGSKQYASFPIQRTALNLIGVTARSLFLACQSAISPKTFSGDHIILIRNKMQLHLSTTVHMFKSVC